MDTGGLFLSNFCSKSRNSSELEKLLIVILRILQNFLVIETVVLLVLFVNDAVWFGLGHTINVNKLADNNATLVVQAQEVFICGFTDIHEYKKLNDVDMGKNFLSSDILIFKNC